MSNYPDDFKGTNMDDRSEEVDTRNEDEIIAARLDAKEHYGSNTNAPVSESNVDITTSQGGAGTYSPNTQELMTNAHPDSILGCMGRIKASLNKFNGEKDE